MHSENLIIVVDGGASGCRLAAFDNNGQQLADAENGPASLSLNTEDSWQHISNGLSSLADLLGNSADWQPEFLYMGLAGTQQDSRYQHFLSLIPKQITPCIITDGHAQLLGASDGKPGVCLAMGTGSVVNWLDQHGNSGHAGGWGYPMSDEGSGAWLGQQLINSYLWYRDQSNANKHTVSRSTAFSKLESVIGTSVSEVQLWSTCSSSTQVASLAPIVVDSASHGDTLCTDIIARGAHYCIQLIGLAPNQLPVYVAGGLAEPYLPFIKRHYSDRCKSVAGNALNGLYIYATQHATLKI